VSLALRITVATLTISSMLGARSLLSRKVALANFGTLLIMQKRFVTRGDKA
jgi:hypothetical protein